MAQKKTTVAKKPPKTTKTTKPVRNENLTGNWDESAARSGYSWAIPKKRKK